MRSFFACVVVLLLSGCSVLKSSEAPDYGFVPHPKRLTKNRLRAAFNKSWIAAPEIYRPVKGSYDSVYVKPIDIGILSDNFAQEIEDKEELQDRIDEAQEIANYFYNKIKLVLDSDPEYPLTHVDRSGPNTYVIELALVELDPTNRVINAAGTVAGFFVPGGGVVKIAGKSRVAMEGVVSGHERQPLLEQFKDRETDKTSFFSVKDYQKYAHVRVAIDDWSMQLVQIPSSSLDSEIADSLPIAISPF